MLAQYKGIFYALFSSMTFTCTNFTIKRLRVDFFDALLCRFFLQTSILAAYILYKRNGFIHGTKFFMAMQLVRTLIGTTSFFLLFHAYRYLPQPVLTTCRYTQVVWTAIFTRIVFRERITKLTILAIVFNLSGVLFVAQPSFLFTKQQTAAGNRTADIDFESDRTSFTFGLFLAITSAIFASMSMTMNKKLLVSNIPQSVIMFDFSFVTFILLIVYHLHKRLVLDAYAKQTMFTPQFHMASVISLAQVMSAVVANRALRIENLSVFAVVRSSDILFSLTLQTLFTRTKPDGYMLMGASLVIVSIILVAIAKYRKSREKTTD